MTPKIGDVIFVAVKPIAKMAAIALGGALFSRKGRLSSSRRLQLCTCILADDNCTVAIGIGILSQATCKANASVIINFLMPLLIFSSVTSAFDSRNITNVVAVLITGMLYQLMGLFFGVLVRCLTPVPKTWKSGVLAAGAFCNWGDLIIAFVTTLAKSPPFNGQPDIDSGIAYSSLLMVTQLLVMFNLGGIQLIQRDFRLGDGLGDAEKAPSNLRTKVSAIVEKTRNTVGLVPKSSQCRWISSEAQPAPAVQLFCEGAGVPEAPVLDVGLSTRPTSPETQPIPASERTAVAPVPENDNSIDRVLDSQSPAAEISVSSLVSSIKQSQPEPRTSLVMKIWAQVSPFLTPPSVSMILALVVANVPQLKALFVRTDSFTMPSAPDGRPPLDFVMEIASFGGSAVPVIGMVLLGTALSKLTVKSLPKGFWKSVVSMAFLKLVVGPIFGLVWTTQVVDRTGLIDPDDKMLRFILIMCSGVPIATSNIYITHLFAPTDTNSSVEMSALSAMLLAQYIAMLLTLTVLVSYTLMCVVL